MSVRVNFAFEKSEICIENSIKPKWAISFEWLFVRGEFEDTSVRVNFAFEKSEICIENFI